MNFFIASDHAGFELKKLILQSNPEIKDLGPKEFIKEDDYPDYTYILCKKILQNTLENRGILICHNGGGVCIAANKFKGIRAGLAISNEHSKTLISDDNINILCLPAEYIEFDEIKKIITTFLNSKFVPEERHLRRLDKVSIIENSSI